MMEQEATLGDLCKKIDKLMEEVHSISHGFVKNEDGTVDYDGHRRYHASIIASMNAQEKFWNELRLDLAKKGLWFVLLVVAGFVVLGIQTKLGLTK
jgi:hypothetical protein